MIVLGINICRYTYRHRYRYRYLSAAPQARQSLSNRGSGSVGVDT